MECALRALNDSVPGLSDRWVHGVAAVGLGRLSFTAFRPPGLRIRNPFKEPVDLDVSQVSTNTAPLAASTWGLGPSCVGLWLVTPDGVVEAAVYTSEHAVWAADRLTVEWVRGA
jgi:hypothetical protein